MLTLLTHKRSRYNLMQVVQFDEKPCDMTSNQCKPWVRLDPEPHGLITLGSISGSAVLRVVPAILPLRLSGPVGPVSLTNLRKAAPGARMFYYRWGLKIVDYKHTRPSGWFRQQMWPPPYSQQYNLGDNKACWSSL